jgi:hypothetical protein
MLNPVVCCYELYRFSTNIVVKISPQILGFFCFCTSSKGDWQSFPVKIRMGWVSVSFWKSEEPQTVEDFEKILASSPSLEMVSFEILDQLLRIQLKRRLKTPKVRQN